jgi:hypothetical protein
MTSDVLRKVIDRWQLRLLVVGVVAFAICFVGGLLDPSQLFRAYLFNYLFLLGLALGSLAIVMIHHLTGGAWGVLVRRLAEAQMKMLPVAALLFAPIAFGLPHIYAWAGADAVATEVADSHWSRYLDPRFFCLRAVGYFVIWLALAAMMTAWSRRQDDAPDVRTSWRAYKSSGFGLLLLAITLHFAAIDWIMSLQPGFTSTIFGPLVFSSQLLSGFALTVILFCWLVARPEFTNILSSKVMNDLGSLLFTLLVLWAYLAWFQFMLIWIADLPRGNVWYLVRWHGIWRGLAIYLIVVHFAIPFVLLLFRAVKQNRMLLGIVAAVIFAGQWTFMYYQVMPVFEASGFGRHWMDLVMPLGIGGVWFAGLLWLIKRRPLLPVYDLNYRYASHLHELDVEELAREEVVANVG